MNSAHFVFCTLLFFRNSNFGSSKSDIREAGCVLAGGSIGKGGAFQAGPAPGTAFRQPEPD
jgi:hypothetical protein